MDRNNLQLAHPALDPARHRAAQRCKFLRNRLHRGSDVLGIVLAAQEKPEPRKAVRNRRSDDRLDVDVPFSELLAERGGPDQLPVITGIIASSMLFPRSSSARRQAAAN